MSDGCNVRDDVPANILTELWDEDDGEAAYVSESEYDDPEYESHEEVPASTYSQLTSPHRIRSRPPYDICPSTSSFPMVSSPERDRSPLRPDNPVDPCDVVLCVYDEEGNAEMPTKGEAFETPDAHELFERLGHEHGVLNDERHSNVGDRRASMRGRGRAARRRSVRARGRLGRGREGERQWAVGDPLHHIYMTDNDVPPELLKMVIDVVRKREEIMNRAKTVRIAREADRLNEEHDRHGQEDDEFQDAIDGSDNALLKGEHLRFDWFPMESFRGEEEVFVPERTGSVYRYSSAYEAFRSYWNDDILQQIVDKTNEYATKISSTTFRSEWYPTNIDEIMCLFAFWMMLGVIRMPTIKSCFSMNPILKTEIFRQIITLKRHDYLTRALQFSDADPANDPVPSNSDPAASFDRLYCLRSVLDHLNIKFKENYILSKDICIGESSTLCKGKINFKQNSRSKVAEFGIKTFNLCESSTGYLWSFIVDTGEKTSSDILNPLSMQRTAVVQKLMSPLLNKGYRLFMDDWYNSPLLARYLKQNGTDCAGTLQPTILDVPVLLSCAPLKQGQFLARHSGDVCVMAWQDNKRVTLLSTCHGAATGLPTVLSKFPVRPQQFKPQIVLDCSKSMRGVHLKDQMLEPYVLERARCGKWYMNLFKHLLNSSILNARILLQSSSQTHIDHLHFRLTLVDSILKNHLSHCPINRRRNVPSTVAPHFHPGINQNLHWPVYMPQNESNIRNNRKHRELCNVCLREGRKTQRTPYMCELCKVPLCAVYCFKTFHLSR